MPEADLSHLPPPADDAALDAALEAAEAAHGVKDAPEVPQPQVPAEPSTEAPRARDENGRYLAKDKTPATPAPQTQDQPAEEPQAPETPEGDYLEAVRSLGALGLDPKKLNLSREQVMAMAPDANAKAAELKEKFDQLSAANGQPKTETPGDGEPADTVGGHDLAELSKQVTQQLTEELGSEAGETVGRYFNGLMQASERQSQDFRKQNEAQSALVAELLGETQRLQLGRTYPALLEDNKAWQQVSDEAAIRFKAGAELGKYPDGIQGMRQAFSDAARQLLTSGPDPRDSSLPTAPTSRISPPSNGEKMSKSDHDNAVLEAIEAGDMNRVGALQRQWDEEHAYNPFS